MKQKKDVDGLFERRAIEWAWKREHADLVHLLADGDMQAGLIAAGHAGHGMAGRS